MDRTYGVRWIGSELVKDSVPRRIVRATDPPVLLRTSFAAQSCERLSALSVPKLFARRNPRKRRARGFVSRRNACFDNSSLRHSARGGHKAGQPTLLTRAEHSSRHNPQATAERAREYSTRGTPIGDISNSATPAALPAADYMFIDGP